MWWLLTGIGCGTAEEATPQVQTAEAVQEPASASIATAPERDRLARAPVAAMPMPVGEPTVRSCGGAPEEAARVLPTPTWKRNTVSRRAPPTANKPTVPNGSLAPANPDDVGDSARGRAKDGEQLKLRRQLESLGYLTEDEDAEQGAHDSHDADTSGLTKDEKEARNQGQTELDRTVRHPTLEWGATVYLSNDDSMSLASAQRMLYALSRGIRLTPREVRPHEVLNYFSFDSVAPAAGRTFGVLGAAAQEGDTLTVSLAVRGANPARQPLDLTLLVDRSCSMAEDDRMTYTKRGLGLLANNLQRGDRVDLVLFDSGVCTPLENFVVGRDDPALLTQAVEAIGPTSATNLDAGLHEAYRIQTSREAADVHGRNRRVLLVTDAELNTGNVSEDLVSEVGKMLDEHAVKLSGVGVGRNFNDRMLDKLTEKGRGAYVYLGSEAVVDRVFGVGFDSLVRTVAHDVQFSLDLPDSLAMAKFYGEEASTNAAEVDPIHYHAGTTQLFLQDLAIRDGRLVKADPITLRIAYRDATTMEPITEELRTTVGALLDGDRHNLDKGRALMAFTDWVLADTLGAQACADPLATYRSRAEKVPDDAEIAFVNGLVGRRCGVNLAAAPSEPGVAVKIRVDADMPVTSVAMRCGTAVRTQTLSGADTIATFSVAPGDCAVRLEGGPLPLDSAVTVPSTGVDLRCTVRGGRVHCG